MFGGKKRSHLDAHLSQLRGCIERGLSATSEARADLEAEVALVRAIAATVDTKTAPLSERKEEFDVLQALCSVSADESRRRLGGMMLRWAPGLFAGEEEQERQAEAGAQLPSLPEDNYALERFFRLPKHHARHIHGRRHAGTRIVQRGATQIPALDAHLRHPSPFSAAELRPYRKAPVPPAQKAAQQRATVMRRARSQKQRPHLLAELEARYLSSV